jgi:hypothetical protein
MASQMKLVLGPLLSALSPRSKKLFQALTPSYGYLKLRGQLAGTTMIAKYSPDLGTFTTRLDREYPQYGKTMPLPFPEKLQLLADEIMEREP